MTSPIRRKRPRIEEEETWLVANYDDDINDDDVQQETTPSVPSPIETGSATQAQKDSSKEEEKSERASVVDKQAVEKVESVIKYILKHYGPEERAKERARNNKKKKSKRTGKTCRTCLDVQDEKDVMTAATAPLAVPTKVASSSLVTCVFGLIMSIVVITPVTWLTWWKYKEVSASLARRFLTRLQSAAWNLLP